MYSVELNSGVRKLLTNMSFLWAVLAALAWSLPQLGGRELLLTYGRFAAAFWLLGALANYFSIAFTDIIVSQLIIIRLIIEPALGLAFLIATRKATI